jgi:FkbM family methyltransferase
VKLREFAALAGWRGRPRVYGSEVHSFELARDGRVDYAQWLHPGETPKGIRQDVVDHLRTFLRPGDVAIDVGAHSGDSTIPIALACGPTGCVLALEPNPYVFAVLERNARLNTGKTRIVPLNFAAAPRSGPIEFEYSDAGYCNGGRHEGISRWRHGHAFTLTVRGEHLPTYLASHHADLAGRIRFIKVDAEGYDLMVLESMVGIIEHERPFVRAEVYKHTSRAARERLVDFFVTRGYRLQRIESDTNYRGEPLGAADVMRWQHFDVFATPGSVP